MHTQAHGVAVSGLYAYVAAVWSNSLVVVDISNPASPVIRGSVVSSSSHDGVRGARSCGHWPWAPRHAPVPSIAPAALSPAEARSRSHVLCTQAACVAVSGSFAYVTTHGVSNSLVVVDISNLASPVISGSVVSSSSLDGVRGARSCGLWPWAPVPSSRSHPRRSRPLKLARALTCCAHRRFASR